jgi:hypothetical protein
MHDRFTVTKEQRSLALPDLSAAQSAVVNQRTTLGVQTSSSFRLRLFERAGFIRYRRWQEDIIRYLQSQSMSSPSAVTTELNYLPLVQRNSKKRRSNFRPTRKGGKAPSPHKKDPPSEQRDLDISTKVPTQPSKDSRSDENVVEPSGIPDLSAPIEGVAEGSTMALEDARDDGMTANFTTTLSTKRGLDTLSSPKKLRKRKNIGVAVGASRRVSAGESSFPTKQLLTEDTSSPSTLEKVVPFNDATLLDSIAPMAAQTATPFPNFPATSATDDADAIFLAEQPGDKTRLTTFCSRYESRRYLLGRAKKADKQATQTDKDKKADKESEENKKEVHQLVTAGPIVQIVNGEIVLQESSLVVNGSSSKPDDEFSVVEEEAQLAVVGASYNSFVKRRRPQHWTAEETQRFYEALRQVGTDFGTMEVYFDSKRTRKQLKRKYQIESTKNPQLVERSLDPGSRVDIGALSCCEVGLTRVLD